MAAVTSVASGFTATGGSAWEERAEVRGVVRFTARRAAAPSRFVLFGGELEWGGDAIARVRGALEAEELAAVLHLVHELDAADASVACGCAGRAVGGFGGEEGQELGGVAE